MIATSAAIADPSPPKPIQMNCITRYETLYLSDGSKVKVRTKTQGMPKNEDDVVVRVFQDGKSRIDLGGLKPEIDPGYAFVLQGIPADVRASLATQIQANGAPIQRVQGLHEVVRFLKNAGITVGDQKTLKTSEILKALSLGDVNIQGETAQIEIFKLTPLNLGVLESALAQNEARNIIKKGTALAVISIGGETTYLIMDRSQNKPEQNENRPSRLDVLKRGLRTKKNHAKSSHKKIFELTPVFSDENSVTPAPEALTITATPPETPTSSAPKRAETLSQAPKKKIPHKTRKKRRKKAVKKAPAQSSVSSKP